MDKRKNNGGNSTKTTGVDKRKNNYKSALDDAATIKDVSNVLKMVKSKALKDKDMQAAKLFLEYYLGKPHQTIDQHSTHTFESIDMNDWK